MYEDTPQDSVHDLISRGDLRPPSARTAGDRHGRGDLDRLPATRSAATTRRMYTPGEHRRRGRGQRRPRRSLVGLVERRRRAPRRGRRRRSRSARPLVEPPEPGLRFQRKDTEQYHVCLGAPGISRSDPRRFAASILDAILGGSASSRLFQEIREKRGMAYSVYSFASQYTDTGPDRDLRRHARGQSRRGARDRGRADRRHRRAATCPTRELERAKENLKGRVLLSMESTSTRMNRLGKSLVTDSEILSFEQVIAEVDAVERRVRCARWPPSCSHRSGSRPPGSGRARSGSWRPSSA